MTRYLVSLLRYRIKIVEVNILSSRKRLFLLPLLVVVLVRGTFLATSRRFHGSFSFTKGDFLSPCKVDTVFGISFRGFGKSSRRINIESWLLPCRLNIEGCVASCVAILRY